MTTAFATGVLGQHQSLFFRLPGEIRNQVYECCRTNAATSFTFIDIAQPRDIALNLFNLPGFLKTCKQIYNEAYGTVCASHAEITAITYPDFRNGNVCVSSNGVFRPLQLRSLTIRYIYNIRPTCDRLFPFVYRITKIARNLSRIKVIIDHGLDFPRPEWTKRGCLLTTFYRLIPVIEMTEQLESVQLEGPYSLDMAKLLRIKLAEEYKEKQIKLYTTMEDGSPCHVVASDLEVSSSDARIFDRLHTNEFVISLAEAQDIMYI
ncbi:hypothetical protein F5Y11DRAFT_320443 [Daldinia sp. FL1419]|nr:hypothetical protein F5Y11DRAFT_320443 [Daldinia sp. FL1419]